MLNTLFQKNIEYLFRWNMTVVTRPSYLCFWWASERGNESAPFPEQAKPCRGAFSLFRLHRTYFPNKPSPAPGRPKPQSDVDSSPRDSKNPRRSFAADLQTPVIARSTDDLLLPSHAPKIPRGFLPSGGQTDKRPLSRSDFSPRTDKRPLSRLDFPSRTNKRPLSRLDFSARTNICPLIGLALPSRTDI